MPDPPVLVSLTTLPSRIGWLRPTLDSLRAQSRQPDRIFVCVPRRSTREACEYVLPAWLDPPPPGVEVLRCERDSGPATKLLGCLERVTAPACLIVVDDDMVYRPDLVERLARAQLARRDASFSFFVSRIGRVRYGYGADGFSFWTPNLRGIEAFAEAALASPHLFVADDLWVSAFLQDRGVAIKSLGPTLGRGEYVWTRTHRINQLSDLDGALRRSAALREGLAFLCRRRLGGWRLRLRCRLSRLERAAAALAWRARRLTGAGRPAAAGRPGGRP